MNTYQIHDQLATAVRASAVLRQELSMGELSLFLRLTKRARQVYLKSCIDSLTGQLRRGY